MALEESTQPTKPANDQDKVIYLDRHRTVLQEKQEELQAERDAVSRQFGIIESRDRNPNQHWSSEQFRDLYRSFSSRVQGVPRPSDTREDQNLTLNSLDALVNSKYQDLTMRIKATPLSNNEVEVTFNIDELPPDAALGFYWLADKNTFSKDLFNKLEIRFKDEDSQTFYRFDPNHYATVLEDSVKIVNGITTNGMNYVDGHHQKLYTANMTLPELKFFLLGLDRQTHDETASQLSEDFSNGDLIPPLLKNIVMEYEEIKKGDKNGIKRAKRNLIELAEAFNYRDMMKEEDPKKYGGRDDHYRGNFRDVVYSGILPPSNSHILVTKEKNPIKNFGS